MKPSVLVLDGEQRATLAVVRSLGQRGISVHVASHVPKCIGGGSRYAASESIVPDPMAGGKEYADAVVRLVQKRGAGTVLPVTESAILSLLENREQFGSVSFPIADLERFRRATDKEAVLRIATQLSIDVPDQFVATGGNDVDRIEAERFPLVVKPARSVVADAGVRRKVAVQYARDRKSLKEVLNDLGPEAGPFLLQTRITGPGVGIFLLRWNGRILATFAHQRIREKPPSGGVSVCCESIAAPTELIVHSIQLLEALDWQGVAMIEYKQDHRSGRHYLMEINPRFWGSLQLAIDAGVDFPWCLYQAINGAQLDPIEHWEVGRRSRWCWGEVDHLLTRLRRADSALHLPAHTPALLPTALQILMPWRSRQKSDVFRWSDPVPGWRETVSWFRDLL